MAPILTAEAVVAGYGSTPAAGPASFACGLGQAVGIHGSPGSGKSTLLQMLMGRAELFEGSCRLFDQEIRARTWAMGLWKRPIGAVWNTRDAPDGLTATEALKLVGAMTNAGRFIDDDIGEWVGTTPLAHRLPNMILTLSGGERTALAAACALARARGGLLIFDDMTASLQPCVATSLVNLIKKRVDLQELAVIFTDDSSDVRTELATYEVKLPEI